MIHMQRRNKFEMKAHDIQFRKPRPSWEHTIKTYQGNNTKVDWITVGVCLVFLGLVLGALSALI